jgi:hypothetical protein
MIPDTPMMSNAKTKSFHGAMRGNPKHYAEPHTYMTTRGKQSTNPSSESSVILQRNHHRQSISGINESINHRKPSSATESTTDPSSTTNDSSSESSASHQRNHHPSAESINGEPAGHPDIKSTGAMTDTSDPTSERSNERSADQAAGQAVKPSVTNLHRRQAR